MANDKKMHPAPGMPTVNRLSAADIADCLRAGIADVVRAPLFGLFFGGADPLRDVVDDHSAGDPLSWPAVLTVAARQRERQAGWMAFVVQFIFWIWIYQVRLLPALFLGFKPFSSLAAFVAIVTSVRFVVENR